VNIHVTGYEDGYEYPSTIMEELFGYLSELLVLTNDTELMKFYDSMGRSHLHKDSSYLYQIPETWIMAMDNFQSYLQLRMTLIKTIQETINFVQSKKLDHIIFSKLIKIAKNGLQVQDPAIQNSKKRKRTPIIEENEQIVPDKEEYLVDFSCLAVYFSDILLQSITQGVSLELLKVQISLLNMLIDATIQNEQTKQKISQVCLKIRSIFYTFTLENANAVNILLDFLLKNWPDLSNKIKLAHQVISVCQLDKKSKKRRSHSVWHRRMNAE